MHRLRRMRTRMPSRRHQARHRAWSGKMAPGEYRIRQEMAEYPPEEGIPARREGLRGYGRQIREVFFSCSWDRRLTGYRFHLTLISVMWPKMTPGTSGQGANR